MCVGVFELQQLSLLNEVDRKEYGGDMKLEGILKKTCHSWIWNYPPQVYILNGVGYCNLILILYDDQFSKF